MSAYEDEDGIDGLPGEGDGFLDEDEQPQYCGCTSCPCRQIVDAPGRCPMCSEACAPAAGWEEKPVIAECPVKPCRYCNNSRLPGKPTCGHPDCNARLARFVAGLKALDAIGRGARP